MNSHIFQLLKIIILRAFFEFTNISKIRDHVWIHEKISLQFFPKCEHFFEYMFFSYHKHFSNYWLLYWFRIIFWIHEYFSKSQEFLNFVNNFWIHEKKSRFIFSNSQTFMSFSRTFFGSLNMSWVHKYFGHLRIDL